MVGHGIKIPFALLVLEGKRSLGHILSITGETSHRRSSAKTLSSSSFTAGGSAIQDIGSSLLFFLCVRGRIPLDSKTTPATAWASPTIMSQKPGCHWLQRQSPPLT
ncbi:hypothetical protein V8G54_010160 [Vigna mungo]|uniref:Uncharacterized protein n=1 Tax=Vigna mungo TaxID=3915 RepID=A0AAQ3S5I8_VIGMU